mmetsp:Transcript_4352/g.15354  ORF Transcript_4352/g.15354 Transcript_4352/m.15354 type:complete len:249 (-) Transcript_4352:561-1307(-)
MQLARSGAGRPRAANTASDRAAAAAHSARSNAADDAAPERSAAARETVESSPRPKTSVRTGGDFVALGATAAVVCLLADDKRVKRVEPEAHVRLKGTPILVLCDVRHGPRRNVGDALRGVLADMRRADPALVRFFVDVAQTRAPERGEGGARLWVPGRLRRGPLFGDVDHPRGPGLWRLGVRAGGALVHGADGGCVPRAGVENVVALPALRRHARAAAGEVNLRVLSLADDGGDGGVAGRPRRRGPLH